MEGWVKEECSEELSVSFVVGLSLAFKLPVVTNRDSGFVVRVSGHLADCYMPEGQSQH
jgi:hypothetical protein